MAKEKKGANPTRVGDKIEQSLLDARRIFISDAVDNHTASDIIRKLWYLESIDPGKPILFRNQQPRRGRRFRFRYLGSSQHDHIPCHHPCDRTCCFHGLRSKPLRCSRKAFCYSQLHGS